MTLRNITREIINLVEEISGIPVRVVEDKHLQVIATVRMARKGILPNHVILYKPRSGEAPDYQICFQCGYIIRLFSNPPEKRFGLVESEKGRDAVDKLISDPEGVFGRLPMRPEQAAALRTQYLSGLLVHLRSVPVGLQVSKWLASFSNEIAALERDHVQEEIAGNKQSLNMEIKQFTPKEIFRATISISAAYAMYWAEKYSMPKWVTPYRLEKFEKPGQDLLEIFNKTPDDPDHDCELIDAWGSHLGVRDWYAWVPYES